MNNAGQAALVGLMIGAIVILAAVIMVAPLGDVVEDQQSASNLDCDNSSISDGKKAACLVMDLFTPYFIGIAIFAAGAYITARYVI